MKKDIKKRVMPELVATIGKASLITQGCGGKAWEGINGINRPHC